jgi:hypothetical protein
MLPIRKAVWSVSKFQGKYYTFHHRVAYVLYKRVEKRNRTEPFCAVQGPHTLEEIEKLKAQLVAQKEKYEDKLVLVQSQKTALEVCRGY